MTWPTGSAAGEYHKGDAVAPQLDEGDTQGLVATSYRHLVCAAYRLLQIEDRDLARVWLLRTVGDVTKADKEKKSWAFNIALSCEGLRALGLDEDTLRTFSPAFLDGMTSKRRARILGDTGPNHPEQWRWGGPANPVHVLLLIYGENETERDGRLDQWAPGPGSGMRDVVMLIAGRQPDTKEHFGFMDGVGQPTFDRQRRDRQQKRTGHATELPLGEFILGYENAYHGRSLSPTVAAESDPEDALPGSQDAASRHDLGLNGSYLVFRQLAQDVPAFWDFVTKAAGALWPGDPDGPTRLAAKFVGRWPSGAPLTLYPERDPFDGKAQEKPANDFAYAAEDPHGRACPFGAHIRRSNPRDSLGPTPKQARESANRHRLLRRGRLYGDRIANRMLNDGKERGLHFICLNADIERQFEFVQQTWVNNPVFAGLYHEADPLIGNQESCSGAFTIQADPLRLRVPNLGSFVQVLGGGYFFLPGLRALRYLFRADAQARR